VTASIAIFGNLTIDDLIYADGSTRWAVPGGGAVYAAFGAAIWTEPVSIVAPLGADYPIEILDRRFDLSRCPPIPRTLRNWGLHEDDGTRHFISRSASRDWRGFSPKPEHAASGHQTVAHIAPMPNDVAIELIKELRKAGVHSISLDLDDHDLAGRADLDATIELLRGSDLLLPSLQDALALFPGLGALEALWRLRSVAPDVALIAVKCGADGVIAHAKGASEWVHVPAMPVELVDATGAGDAFCGGALAGFSKECSPIEALLAGTVSASFCIEGLGLAGLVAAAREKADIRISALRKRIEVHQV
jgi:sugar/nucleoside kinase (ribokinase family)